jgi:phosphohistidine phosphatase SixA
LSCCNAPGHQQQQQQAQLMAAMLMGLLQLVCSAAAEAAGCLAAGAAAALQALQQQGAASAQCDAWTCGLNGAFTLHMLTLLHVEHAPSMRELVLLVDIVLRHGLHIL